MKLGDIIRAEKEDLKVGDWKIGKIPASAFPINKQKRLPQSSSWQWRVIEFKALEQSFRLLIRLNSEICYYSSILGMEQKDKLLIICHHEYHESHRNWHCHFIPKDVRDTFPGVLRDSERMTVYEAQPSGSGKADFLVTANSALSIAASRFRFDAEDEESAQGILL